MKSATSNIDLDRIKKLLCSAFFIAGMLVWLLAATAQAAPSHILNEADDASGEDARVFDLVQAKDLDTSLPTSFGELMSKVPDALKLDLSIRVNRVFRAVFESETEGNTDGEPLFLIEKDIAKTLVDVPEALIPTSSEDLVEETADDMGWSVLQGEDGPLIRRQMYRTDI